VQAQPSTSPAIATLPRRFWGMVLREGFLRLRTAGPDARIRLLIHTTSRTTTIPPSPPFDAASGAIPVRLSQRHRPSLRRLLVKSGLNAGEYKAATNRMELLRKLPTQVPPY